MDIEQLSRANTAREHAAINNWFATDAARERCDPKSLKAPAEPGQYLGNRIWHTLTEGIEIGRRLQQEYDCALLMSILER